ncbi:hypothetical protein [Domibacillus sp.]|uniref:hypothetical protein n=1 Tax=Domibacillus sp. TaxID=1969783 RepID=UPI0028128B6D|nr:hypothetical protein [Domibacillus sp.]
MTHAIDLFCVMRKETIEKLAERLGVTSCQLESWKAGIEEIPTRHFDNLKTIFRIPDEKEYLIERTNVTVLDQAEISLICYKDYIESLQQERVKNSQGASALSRAFRQCETAISSIEKQIRILKQKEKMESIFDERMFRLACLNEEEFRKREIIVDRLIDKLDDTLSL